MLILTALVAWMAVSIPAAVVIGLVLRCSRPRDVFEDLVGMDGAVAVLRVGHGRFARIDLAGAADPVA